MAAFDFTPFTNNNYTVVRSPVLDPSGTDAWIVKGLEDEWVIKSQEDFDRALAKATERKQASDLLRSARANFRDNFQNWPTMTSGQKDAANRQAQRALADLIGYVMKDTEGGTQPR